MYHKSAKLTRLRSSQAAKQTVGEADEWCEAPEEDTHSEIHTSCSSEAYWGCSELTHQHPSVRWQELSVAALQTYFSRSPGAQPPAKNGPNIGWNQWGKPFYICSHWGCDKWRNQQTGRSCQGCARHRTVGDRSYAERTRERLHREISWPQHIA